MRIERDDAKIGIMVIVAFLVFGSLLMYRSVKTLATRETLLKVRLASASDVVVGTEVQLQGLRVGQINRIELERQGVEYTFLVTLGVQKDLTLWKGTRALVISRIVGGSYLGLELPPVRERVQALEPGSVLEAGSAVSLASVLEEAQKLIRNLNGGVTEVRDELRHKGLGAILDTPALTRTLGGLDRTMEDYRALAREGQVVARQGDKTLQTLDRDLESAGRSLTQVQGLLERRSPELDGILVNLAATLQHLQALSSDAQKLLKEGGPEAEASLKALHRDLKAAEELLELLKAKPSRILWGKPSAEELKKAHQAAEKVTQP